MNDQYVADLIARMGDPARRRDALQEIESINDVAVLTQVEPLVRGTRKSGQIQSLAKILGGLARNMPHPQIATLYALLLEKPRLTGVTVRCLIEYAPESNLNQFAGWVRLQLNHTDGNVVSAAIQYLGKSGGPEDLQGFGELLDRDCDGRCHPMYCIFAFEENGRREGIPYIQHAIERHASGRHKMDEEICGFGSMALKKFAGLPSEVTLESGDGTVIQTITHHGDGTVSWSHPADDEKQP